VESESMVRLIKHAQLSKCIKKNPSNTILVAVLTPGADPSSMKNAGLADDLQHKLTNLCRPHDTVDVVLVSESSSEVQIFQGQRLMHVILDPTARSVIEAYRVACGHYTS
jgi:hypothetical protein